MKKLTLALLLVALLVSAFAACGGSSTGNTTTTDGKTDPVTDAVTVDESEVLELPDDLTFTGEEFSIATWNGGNANDQDGWANYLDFDEPDAGNLLQEAAYTRNEWIRDRLGVEITVVEDLWNWNGTSEGLMAVIGICSLSGKSTIDLIIYQQYGYEALIIDELIADVAAMPHIDLDKAWYNQMANNTYYLRDNLYVFFSDICYPCQNAVTVLFNKDMLTDLQYAENYLYEKVENGEWTLDLVFDMIDGTWVDVNADGQADLGDKFGFHGTPMGPCYFYPAAGLKGTYLTDDGFAFDYGTDFSFEVINRVIDLVDNENTYFAEWDYYSNFVEGRSLFSAYASELYQLPNRIGTTFEFGILPFPKYTETQETYYSPASGGIALIPANIEDENFVGAVIEAMAYGSHQYLVPAFYDNYMEQGVMSDDYARENWKRMLNDWGFYEFTYVIAPDDRVRYYDPAYRAIEYLDRDFASTWGAMKGTVEEICSEFYEWYLS